MNTVATRPPLALEQLNRMDAARFVETFGGIFEHSPWVAEAAHRLAPFDSVDALHAAMIGAVRAAPRPQLLAFLRLHPELAGKEAQAGTMTDHSTHEQSGAGLNAMTRDEIASLRRMNAAYAERHGFPFIIAVLANSKQQILDALRTRTAADSEAEIAAALGQISIITRRRLDKLLAAG